MPTRRSIHLITILTCVMTMACTVGIAQREDLIPPATETPPAPSPFPALLSQVPLASEGAQLHDLVLDKNAGRLYVTDTADQLHVLDAKTYTELAVLPAGANLLLDAARGRLYVSPGWFVYGDTIAVVDTAGLTVTSVISGNSVAIDTARNRLYVGDSSVSVYDGATLEKLGEISQPGIPTYNPLRDEVYIVDDTVYRADAETWQITGDLLPDVTAQTCHRCTGNIAAYRAYVYPERNLLVVDMFTRASSGGPGYVIGPRFFDATTLEPIADPTQTPATIKGCEERFILTEPVEGRTYRGEKVVRYTVYNNLMVYGPDGTLETWRDGLEAGITNPRTAQMYTPYNEGLLVLDLPALTPVGSLPATCVHSLDAESGILYAFDGGDLVVFAERGGDPASPPAGIAETLPATAVGLIELSPNYPADHTLFVGFFGESSFNPARLYRSTDGGQTWTHLRGGLPESEYLALTLAISPGFAQDHTLFAGGYIYTGQGTGVYRSTDGGDTWESLWSGLSHLRVYDIIPSPNYPADGTLLAYAEYNRIIPGESGWAVHRSTDRGMTWSPVVTVTERTSLSYLEGLLPPDPAAPAIRFRLAAGSQRAERSTDGGRTWHAVSLNRLSSMMIFQAIQPSPNIAADHTVYVLAEDGLFRSTDDGDKWQRPLDERLAGRDWSRRLTAIAITPLLEDGRRQFFVGTAVGELLMLDPEELAWAPVEIAPQWPTVLEGERINAIEIAPDGAVWMSVQGSGLVRYADGVIQARYTVADGLPSPYVSAITAAPDGSIWIGTETPAGVARFDPSASGGTPASGGGGHSWTAYPLTEEQAGLTVWDVAVAPDGTVWIGTDKAGVMRWDGHAWERIADPADRVGYLTRDIEIGSDGTLWCATPGGLAFYKDGMWSIGWSSEVFAVKLGRAGSAMIIEGEESRTVRQYVDGEWLLLPPVKDPYGPALYVAADGAVWIGTLKGAFRYDGQAWRQFAARDGLPHDEVFAIAEDAEGRLWFGTANGAAYVDPATLNLTPVER